MEKKDIYIPDFFGYLFIVMGMFFLPAGFSHKFGPPLFLPVAKFLSIPTMLILVFIISVILFKVNTSVFLVFLVSFIIGTLIAPISKFFLLMWQKVPEEYNWLRHYIGMGFCLSLIFSGAKIIKLANPSE